MNTASLELCKELYELSTWGNPDDPESDEMLIWCANKGQELSPWNPTERSDYSFPGFNETGIPAYDLGYLWRKADEITGNEFAVGYNDSGACYHFTWGNRGAGFMTEGIGEHFTAEPAEIEDSFAQWLIYLLQSA